MFINIHSHRAAKSNEWTIQNLNRGFGHTTQAGIYSIGLHPWYIEEMSWPEQFSQLKKYSTQEQVVAIGECGLDKVCTTNFSLQQEVFTAQLLWANEINKPLIIHCVRAFDEVLQLLADNNNKVPVVFHGFNKNRQLAEKIMLQGHWLSFGKAVLNPGKAELFSAVPDHRFFLETDDTAISIASLYKSAAEIKQISIEQLSLQLSKNVQTVFNKTVMEK